jgi:hypothetical protein
MSRQWKRLASSRAPHVRLLYVRTVHHVHCLAGSLLVSARSCVTKPRAALDMAALRRCGPVAQATARSSQKKRACRQLTSSWLVTAPCGGDTLLHSVSCSSRTASSTDFPSHPLGVIPSVTFTASAASHNPGIDSRLELFHHFHQRDLPPDMYLASLVPTGVPPAITSSTSHPILPASVGRVTGVPYLPFVLAFLDMAEAQSCMMLNLN